MRADCVFCRIVAGSIPSVKIHEDADFLAFPDLHPKAATHLLVIPKKHCVGLIEADEATRGALLTFAVHTAEKVGLKEGFRTVINTGRGGGQVVFHLHAHILAGTDL